MIDTLLKLFKLLHGKMQKTKLCVLRLWWHIKNLHYLQYGLGDCKKSLVINNKVLEIGPRLVCHSYLHIIQFHFQVPWIKAGFFWRTVRSHQTHPLSYASVSRYLMVNHIGNQALAPSISELGDFFYFFLFLSRVSNVMDIVN